jgi:BolA protein
VVVLSRARAADADADADAAGADARRRRATPETPHRGTASYPRKRNTEHRNTTGDENHRKLEAALRPTSLTIVNESHKHAGHSGNPSGAADAETHFRVVVVSPEFEGKRLVARHQMVYGLVDEEIRVGGVHALSMDTRTPGEAEGK